MPWKPKRRYQVVSTPGSVELQTHTEWPEGRVRPPNRTGRAEGRAGAPIGEFSNKTRRGMRKTFNAIPWDEYDRLHMMVLTYPAAWRQWCPDGEALRKHMDAFRKRWDRKWGQPMAAWGLEFQPREDRPQEERQAPHINIYAAIPADAVLGPDSYNGRLAWDWARQAWWEIVGSGDANHRWWGVFIEATFQESLGDVRGNARRVGDYFWRESGKWAQHDAPEGFAGLKWYGLWGLKPRKTVQEVEKLDGLVALRDIGPISSMLTSSIRAST